MVVDIWYCWPSLTGNVGHFFWKPTYSLKKTLLTLSQPWPESPDSRLTTWPMGTNGSPSLWSFPGDKSCRWDPRDGHPGVHPGPVLKVPEALYQLSPYCFLIIWTLFWLPQSPHPFSRFFSLTKLVKIGFFSLTNKWVLIDKTCKGSDTVGAQ